jgi:hypothetical protein
LRISHITHYELLVALVSNVWKKAGVQAQPASNVWKKVRVQAQPASNAWKLPVVSLFYDSAGGTS